MGLRLLAVLAFVVLFVALTVNPVVNALGITDITSRIIVSMLYGAVVGFVIGLIANVSGFLDPYRY